MKKAVLFLVMVIIASTSIAQVALEPGFRYSEIPDSAMLGPIAVLSGHELIAGAGFFGAQTLVRLDYRNRRTTDFVLGVSDSNSNRVLDGGISSLGDVYYDASTQTVYFTDNFQHGTLFSARDLNGNGKATEIVEINGEWISEVQAVLPAGSFSSAGNIIRLDSETLLVGNAVGNGNGTVIAVQEETGSSYVFASGLDYTSGIAQHPVTGEIYVGNSSFPNPGQIYRLIGDADQSGTMDVSNPLEAQKIVEAITGPYDLVFDGVGTLYVSTAADQILRVLDTNQDSIPDTVLPLASGFSFSGSLDLYPPTVGLNPYQVGGVLYVSDPYAFGNATPTIKGIFGAPQRSIFVLDGFGEVRVISQ